MDEKVDRQTIPVSFLRAEFMKDRDAGQAVLELLDVVERVEGERNAAIRERIQWTRRHVELCNQVARVLGLSEPWPTPEEVLCTLRCAVQRGETTMQALAAVGVTLPKDGSVAEQVQVLKQKLGGSRESDIHVGDSGVGTGRGVGGQPSAEVDAAPSGDGADKEGQGGAQGIARGQEDDASERLTPFLEDAFRDRVNERLARSHSKTESNRAAQMFIEELLAHIRSVERRAGLQVAAYRPYREKLEILEKLLARIVGIPYSPETRVETYLLKLHEMLNKHGRGPCG